MNVQSEENKSQEAMDRSNIAYLWYHSSSLLNKLIIILCFHSFWREGDMSFACKRIEKCA